MLKSIPYEARDFVASVRDFVGGEEAYRDAVWKSRDPVKLSAKGNWPFSRVETRDNVTPLKKR